MIFPNKQVMKTVGIITCHTPLNYGAMLQAYALQKTLSNLGCYPEIINYFPEIFSEDLSLWYVGNKAIKRNVLKIIAYLIIKLPKRIRRHYMFNNFRKKYINIGKHRYRTFQELKADCPKYDLYICGSDQIWNTIGVRGWDPTFYLQFVKDKSRRYSYAASMSLNFPISNEVKNFVIPMVADLNKISVRERLIQKELSPLIDKQIYYSLDPVYLLSDKDWSRLAEEGQSLKEKYILLYPMDEGTHVVANAKLLSYQTGLPIYCITASSRKISGVARHFNCSISQFVKLFRDASYVITNSFHGTAFSIIFRKTFWSCEVASNNHRITNILQELNLFNRYIAKEDKIDLNNLTIDYSKANDPLESYILQSKQYLSNIVNG